MTTSLIYLVVLLSAVFHRNNLLCSACAAGDYKNAANQCKQCLVGNYCSADKIYPCPVGQCQPLVRKPSCTNCAVGTYADITGNANCSPCPAGKYTGVTQSTSCSVCGFRTYSYPGSSACTSCPAGTKYSNVPGDLPTSCLACNPGSYSVAPVSLVCTSCSAGTFSGSNSSSCTSCPAGTYSGAGASSCLNCSAGKYSNSGSTSCTSCPAGKYSSTPRSGSCTPCAANTYSSSGAISCTPCPIGSYSGVGSTLCSLCPAGQIPGAGVGLCVTCPAGKYSIPGDIICSICPAGTYSAASSGFCTPCDAGKTSAAQASSCSICPGGTYAASGDPTCTSCAGGTCSLAQSGSCTTCNPGKFSGPGSSSCSNCPATTYSLSGASACTSCPIGTANNVVGSSTCIICPNGTYAGSGSLVCLPCLPGTYNPIPEQGSCINCPRDTFNGLPGKDACNICPIGTFAPPASGACTVCYQLCARCNGGTDSDCSECKSYTGVVKIGTTCMCTTGFYYDSTKAPDYCQPCHEFCSACSGNKLNCQACIVNPGVIFTGSSCICDTNKYLQAINLTTGLQECATCFPLCQSCYGLTNYQCTTCDPKKKAIYKFPNSCVCLSRYYYDRSIEDCSRCHPYCVECTGPSSQECIGCVANTFPIEDKPTQCVESCTESGPYYLSGNVCKKCHSECDSCYGSLSTNCILCSNQTKVQLGGICVDGCPPYFYVNIARICEFCHPTCKYCVNTTLSGCLMCTDGYYLYQGSCLTYCPQTYYKGDGVCIKCIEPCDECKSEEKCINCAKGYYLDTTTGDCGTECPPLSYGDDITRTCKTCHFTCLTCNGITKRDCVKCNFLKGYTRITGDVGECHMQVCVDGDFLFVDDAKEEVRCEKCDPTCITCNGFGRDNCITCKPGFVPIRSTSGISNARCLACTEIDRGYRNPVGGEVGCQGICGDGLRRANEECDDGNSERGDGCSNLCKVEEDFKCEFSVEKQADICISVVPLTVSIESVSNLNVITVLFSKRAHCGLNSTQFVDKLNITLEDAEPRCPFKWSLNSSYQRNVEFERVVIATKAECLIRGDKEIVRIKFPAIPPIMDNFNNTLKNTELTAHLHRRLYISTTEASVMKSGGSGFSMSTFITFGISIVPAMLQSVAIGQFWAFVNMIQILSYIPTMSILIPKNFEILLTEYLTIVQISLPFNLLPSWVPNPKELRCPR